MTCVVYVACAMCFAYVRVRVLCVLVALCVLSVCWLSSALFDVWAVCLACVVCVEVCGGLRCLLACRVLHVLCVVCCALCVLSVLRVLCVLNGLRVSRVFI